MVEKFKKSLLVVATIFGLVSLLMIFCPAIVFDVEELADIEMNLGIEGLKITFGWELMDMEVFEFSFLSFLTYLLPIAGIVCIVYSEKKSDKRIYYVAIACFAVAALLFFLAPSLIQYAKKEVKKELKDYITLGAGAIIGAISCAISALCVFFHIKNEEQKTAQSQVTEAN